MAPQLLDELGEAQLALRARRLLMGFRHRRADCQVVAHVERDGLDQDVLVALQALELARQPVQALGHGHLALLARLW
ncbi:hypothetical protein D9M68_1007640 [compost metagenome]